VGNAEAVDTATGRFAVVSKPRRLYLRVGGDRPGDFGLSPNASDSQRMRAPGTGAGAKLRAAVRGALRENARFVVPGGWSGEDPGAKPFNILVQPLTSEHETLLLVCFVEAPPTEIANVGRMPAADLPRVLELERELEATKLELQSAMRNIETSSQEQMTINEEALSVNEEFQSTNEELLASKEESQSLNEELNALNGQLQETLDRQRTTADDLRNVLYSTDVATLFSTRISTSASLRRRPDFCST
jgi:two-component system CheB/CheR fusion protein